MKIYQFLISFDLLSPGPELIHKGQPRYTNMFGLLLTLITIGITLYTLKDDIGNFLNDQNPKVVKSTSYKIGNNFTLNSSSLKFFIQIQNFDIDNQAMRILNYSEVDDITRPYGGFPAFGILQINKDGYIPHFITNDKNVSDVFFPFRQCDKSFFDDYNNHLDYQKPLKTDKEIEEMHATAFCLPNYVQANLETSENTKVALATIFVTPIVKVLKGAGFPFLFATLNYQHLVVNTDPINYAEYYRKVWKYSSFYLDPLYREAQFAKIKNTTINRDRKKFVFPADDSNYTMTIESFEQWFKIPTSGGGRDASVMIMMEMDTYDLQIDITYTSLDDIFDRYGGTSSVFFFIGEVIVGFFISPFFTSSLVNEVFKFHENVMDSNEIIDFKNSYKRMFKYHNESEENNENNSDYISKRKTELIKFKNKEDKEEKEGIILNNTNPELEINNQPIEFNIIRNPTNKNEDLKLNIKPLELKDSNRLSNRLYKDDSKENKNGVEPLDTNVMGKEESIKYKLYKSLEKSLKTRKSAKSSGCEVFKLMYCCCFTQNNKEKIINTSIKYLEQCSEFGNIIKKTREMEILKKLLLKKEQRNMQILPSTNLVIEKEEEEEEEESEVTYADQLYEANEAMKNLDLKVRNNRTLGKNLITSII